MQEKEYQDFFDNFEQFEKKQKKQKQRGLNDFNIFSTIRKKNEEVGLHSNFIYSLLNPHAKHYQDELFLELFVQHVLKILDFGNIISVKREDTTDEQRRIDFTIESDNYLIGIEMKSSHSRGDEPYQLSHYKSELEKNATDEQEVKIYYLTLNGKLATKKSLQYKDSSTKEYMSEEDYQRISFKKHIFEWINYCYNEVKNITNLAVLLTQYKEIVQQISRKDYEGNVMDLSSFMNKNSEMYIQIGKIQNEIPKLAENLENLFWTELNHKLNDSKLLDSASFNELLDNKTRGLRCELFNINIVRFHNLYWAYTGEKNKNKITNYANHIHKKKPVEWKHITLNDKKIDFNKHNNGFWSLGDASIRNKIIEQIEKEIFELISRISE